MLTRAAETERSAALKASLSKFQECASAMRQPFAARRQSVFLFARHFTEGPLLAVGKEYRIIAETAIAARRPDQRAGDARFKWLDVPVGPCKTQRGDKMRATAFRRGRAASLQLLFDLFHG